MGRSCIKYSTGEEIVNGYNALQIPLIQEPYMVALLEQTLTFVQDSSVPFVISISPATLRFI